ncbi:hypothetical protein [Lactovum odontotermitis]
MALTELTWEEVSQYTPIKNNDHLPLFEHKGKYYLVIELGIASVRRTFDLSQFALDAYLSGDKTANDLGFYAENDVWPAPKEKQDEYWKNKYKTDFPEMIPNNAEVQKYFTKAELKEILPEGSDILASKD